MNPWLPLAIFVAVGPIYWFAALGYVELSALKYALLIIFSLKFFYDLRKSKRPFLFPKKFGPLSLVCISCFILLSSYQSTDISAVFAKLSDYFLAFSLVWLTYNASFLYNNFEDVSSKILIFIPIVSILIVTSYFFGFPDWRGPYYEMSFVAAKLDYTGFGPTRTAWSNGVALIYPLILLGGVEFFKRKKLALLFVVVACFMSVFLPGGRGGILAVLLISFFALRFYFPQNFLSLIAMLFILTGSLFLIVETGGDTRAFRKLSSAENLNDLSTGRIESIKVGLDIVQENLLTGKGPGNIDLHDDGLGGLSIHNYWVGIAAEHGILMPVFLALMFLSLFMQYMKKSRYLLEKYRANWYVLLAGFFMSNLEPSGFIGAFQHHAIFWICLGRLLFVLTHKTNDTNISFVKR